MVRSSIQADLKKNRTDINSKYSSSTKNRKFPSNATSEVAPSTYPSKISARGPHKLHTLDNTKKTRELEQIMESYNILESGVGLNRRTRILEKLATLLKQWVRNVSIAQGFTVVQAKKLGGNLYTFGSYRLGVHQKDADIDALCVVPRNIERAAFFKSFYELLRTHPEVSECVAVERAFVPVIKMKFDGVEIDLLLARMALKRIPADLDLRNSALLKHMDPQSVRSLNGCRVTDEILSAVPDVENFRLALRVIKLWAKKNGVYSNILGYLGGVSWAMMVAKVCQVNPNSSAATLVHKFFQLFANWEWPQPVLLKRPKVLDLGFRVWNPTTNAQDRTHLMPIITPAYPEQNSTFNVSVSTRKVIMREIVRGAQIMDEIMSGKSEWHKLFKGSFFFVKYQHFLVLTASSPNANNHTAWRGLVESKIRHLIGGLDRDSRIALAHVHPKNFGPRSSKMDEVDGDGSSTHWLIGLEFRRSNQMHVDLRDPIRDFDEAVKYSASQNGMSNKGMTVEVQHVRRNQLAEFLSADSFHV
ncbi:poly(A) polymerase type 3-like [Toxorhynchites rutilus septentrionalis]|uniref:poly(A) polymerase type 3-like n=1 Tax=Toxorhynchites rutilus septentrionalis TaxID=329112 RepID=UPI0024785CE0|nr:poly(A) polymerase type 3-like [Toxorhynchites rutilus septentrionalis]